MMSEKRKPHVNVGTIGHIDHGKTLIARSVLSTGDYIDPTPWTPEDHERFKKAMKRVHELRSPKEIKADLEISKTLNGIPEGWNSP
jgi:translation elongation factor EF-Tu-like GTPase